MTLTQHTFEVRPHPRLPQTHKIALVFTTTGHTWAFSTTEDLDINAVKQFWFKNRRVFKKYDAGRGVFLG